MTNIFDAISQSCRHNPDRIRLTFQSEAERVETVAAGPLIDDAVELAERLVTISDRGDRVLLAHPPGIDFVIAFTACLRAGLVPVPVSHPKPRRPLSRYQAIAADADARLALTSESMLDRIDSRSLTSVQWLSSERLLNDHEAGVLPDLTSTPGSATAFLQYTSGSTCDPKGVIVTHDNLYANLDVIRAGFQIDQFDVQERTVCSWLPSYHDMGLVGVVLTSLVYDGHAVMMSPTSFLQRPFHWLDLISRYSAKVTVAPSFGYQRVCDTVTDEELCQLDLSCLELAACGAEPIFPDVLRSFAERFSSVGFRREVFYPCYGLAESTLLVTGTDRGALVRSDDPRRFLDELPGPVTNKFSRHALTQGSANPNPEAADAVELVSSGIAAPGTTVRVVDATTLEAVDDSQIGEICVHSASVAGGYWQDAEKTAEAFEVRITDDDRTFLRTGDLGFLRDGQLYVTGRIKDLIIIGGQNHYPQDLERTVNRCSHWLTGVMGAAFSVNESSNQQLVLVHEVPRGFDKQDADALMRAIRLAIVQDHDLAISEIVLIRFATLPRTSSGKVQRSKCRELFEQHALKVVGSWSSRGALDRNLFPDVSAFIKDRAQFDALRSEIESVLVGWLEYQTGAGAESKIRPDQAFADLGIDSLTAVDFSQQLEVWLGIRISPVVAWSYPNAESLSRHLATQILGSPDAEDDGFEDEDTISDFESLLTEIESLDEESVKLFLRDAGMSETRS